MEEYLGKDRKLYVTFVDLEKAYNRFDNEALWNVLKVCGVGRQLMEYREAYACVKVNGELSDSFAIGVEVSQGCVMSSWLFNIFMDVFVREMQAKLGKICARLKLNGLVIGCLSVRR